MYGNLPMTGGTGLAVLGYELGASILVALGIGAVLAGVAATRIAARLRRVNLDAQ